MQYITEQHQVDALLPKLMQYNAWGTDTETTGLDAHKNKVTLIQIGRPEEQYVIDARKVNVQPIKPFFESKEIIKIYHGLKFDYKMLKGSQGIENENGRCTLLAEKILNAGRMFRGFGLSDVLFKYIGIEMDKTLQKSFIDHTGEFSAEQIKYAGDDVKYMLPLLQQMTKDIIADGLGPTFKLECDVVPAFGDMEYDGMIIDKDAWLAIMERNKIKLSEAKAALDMIVEPYVGMNLFNEVDINYGSPVQMVKLFERMRIKVREYDKATRKEIEVKVQKTDAKTLKKLSHIPMVKFLQEYRSLGVRINTFGLPYIEAINPETGAFHPDFDQLGTETGRPAAGDSDVNPLNIPRDNEYRNCFVGRGDEVVESDDYSGCESRILAQISGDKKLIEIFRRNEDIHCAVATALYGKLVTKNNENKKLRTPAKSLNFGIAYGMGPGRLYDELNGQGFPCTRDEAKKLFYKYCDTYKTAVDFLRSAGKDAAAQGYLVNLNGRRRYWIKPDQTNPEYYSRMAGIEREGGNFLIQSVNADITKDSMIGVRNYRKEHNIRTHFINAIYDELVTRTHKDDSAKFHEAKLKIMVASAEKWIKDVPMIVDGHAGKCWQK